MGLPRAAFNYHNMRGVCGKKGLSRATFNYHIMVETEEGKKGCLEPPSTTYDFVGI
jgi:hypothetical protein